MSDPLTRYLQGARPVDFTPGEAAALAEELMARPEYTDRRSRQHDELSKDVRALFEHPTLAGYAAITENMEIIL